MKTNYLILILLLCIAFGSCSKEPSFKQKNYAAESNDYAALDMEEAIDIEPPRTASPKSIKKGSKIIKNGSMALEVNSLKATKARLDSLIHGMEGYYEDETFENSNYDINYHLKIRLPSINFEKFIQAIERGQGKILSKHIQAKDVSEEYLDLNIRLENKLAYLKQYQSILKKAKSIKEILEVQKEIRFLEEEIESKKGRLTFLDDQVKYATLDLTITEIVTSNIEYRPSFFKKMANAFRDGIDIFLDFLLSIISIWPIILLGLILFFSRRQIIGLFRRS